MISESVPFCVQHAVNNIFLSEKGLETLGETSKPLYNEQSQQHNWKYQSQPKCLLVHLVQCVLSFRPFQPRGLGDVSLRKIEIAVALIRRKLLFHFINKMLVSYWKIHCLCSAWMLYSLCFLICVITTCVIWYLASAIGILSTHYTSHLFFFFWNGG